MYIFGKTWYKLIPNAVKSITPTIIKPLAKVTWRYQNPSSFAKNGIYSQSDLDRLRDHIMFTYDLKFFSKRNIRNTYSKSENISNEFIQWGNNWKNRCIACGRFWTLFINFGTTSAGLIGFIIIITEIKIIADTIIHGYALHYLFGRSFHLLGTFWDAVTNLLLHLGTR